MTCHDIAWMFTLVSVCVNLNRPELSVCCEWRNGRRVSQGQHHDHRTLAQGEQDRGCRRLHLGQRPHGDSCDFFLTRTHHVFLVMMNTVSQVTALNSLLVDYFQHGSTSLWRMQQARVWNYECRGLRSPSTPLWFHFCSDGASNERM